MRESCVFKLSEEYREVESTLALCLRDGCKLYTHRLHASCVQREPMFLCVFFLLILATLVRENFGELRVFLVFFFFSRMRQQIFLFNLHAFSLSHAKSWIRPAVTADSLTLLIENYRVWCEEGRRVMCENLSHKIYRYLAICEAAKPIFIQLMFGIGLRRLRTSSFCNGFWSCARLNIAQLHCILTYAW